MKDIHKAALLRDGAHRKAGLSKQVGRDFEPRAVELRHGGSLAPDAAHLEEVLPRDPYSSRNIVQGEMPRMLLPDKLPHFPKDRFGRGIERASTVHGQCKVAEQGEAEAEVKAILQRFLGKGAGLRPSAHLEQAEHSADERNGAAMGLKAGSQMQWNSTGSDRTPTVVGFAIGREHEILAMAGAQEDSVPRTHMDVFPIEPQFEAALVNDNQLIVVLEARTASTARRVEDVSDDCGSPPHAEVFLADIAQRFDSG